MSLAAFSVLIVAFVLITGEASVIPSRSSSRSPPSSSPSYDTSTSTKGTSSFSSATDFLTGSIHTTNTNTNTNEGETHDEMRIPHLRIVHTESWSEGPREWSEKALAEWCLGDDGMDVMGGERALRMDGETRAERRLRYVLPEDILGIISNFGFV